MKNTLILLGLAMTLSLNAKQTQAAPAAETGDKSAELEKFLGNFSWTQGPATGSLGDIAEIQVPEGFRLCGGDDTRAILSAFGNIVGDSELGLLAPDDFNWFVVFEFDAIGYVKDDEKDKLDADDMLKSIRRGTEAGNEQRAEMGIPPMKIIGWDIEPRFNDQTKLLEWAIRAESEGEQILNHNTRILGRAGVMEVALVVEPAIVNDTMPTFYKLLEGYSYKDGQKYAQYRDGDKVAKYGLAALVVGGAAVGAAKLGLFGWLAVMFKKLWKLVVVAFVALGAGIKRLLGGSSNPHTQPQTQGGQEDQA